MRMESRSPNMSDNPGPSGGVELSLHLDALL